jgi:uncharacterized protein (DUF2235 family)
MKKRIVVCADGTWMGPEKDLQKDQPSNVLRLARAIKPLGDDGVPQQVFYDWGVGSYYDPVLGGAMGKGLQKNIMDDYRYIVQNYSPDDEIFLFGFSRGAYTVRSLCGLINNCGIVKRPDAALIEAAFEHYKKSSANYAPDGQASISFRSNHSHPSRQIKFVGVWDTVGALGIPISFLGLFEDKDEFYDTKLGRNVSVARHAMAIDEQREDFAPTIWVPRQNIDIRQVWFAGSHGDVGGSYRAGKSGTLLSDNALDWMVSEAQIAGLTIEPHLLQAIHKDPYAVLHKSRRHFYRIRKPFLRAIDHGMGSILIHESVKQRWDSDERYRPKNLVEYIERAGWPAHMVG